MAWARKSSGVVVMGGFLLKGVAIIPNHEFFGLQGRLAQSPGWWRWLRPGAMMVEGGLDAKDAVAIQEGTLQVADGLQDYCHNSIAYRSLYYKHREAALQVAGRAGDLGTCYRSRPGAFLLAFLLAVL